MKTQRLFCRECVDSDYGMNSFGKRACSILQGVVPWGRWWLWQSEASLIFSNCKKRLTQLAAYLGRIQFNNLKTCHL